MKLKSSSLQFGQRVELTRAGLLVRGYDGLGKFVCRLKINSAGIQVFTGEKGGRQIAYANWEELVKKLQD